MLKVKNYVMVINCDVNPKIIDRVGYITAIDEDGNLHGTWGKELLVENDVVKLSKFMAVDFYKASYDYYDMI